MSRAPKKGGKGATKRRSRESAAELAPRILEVLPAKQAEIARQLGRKPSDGTVRRALRNLAEAGTVVREKGVWERCQELATLASPDDFDDVSRQLYADTLKALQEQGTWREHDTELLTDYVRRAQDARRYRVAVVDQGEFRESKSGRVFAHPGIDKERDARRDVRALRDALVLTPDARKKHGRDGEEDDSDEFDDL